MADLSVRPGVEDVAGPVPEPAQPAGNGPAKRWRWRRWIVGVVVGIAYVVSYRLTDVDLGRLVAGLSTMGGWAAKAWPAHGTGVPAHPATDR